MKFNLLTIIFFISIIFLSNNGYAIKNKILFKVNNEIITSIDLLEETKFLKAINEELENVDMKLVETMRSNGANEMQVFAFGVWPQVKTAFTGILIYTWDVCFRASTIIGFFGAGGMGWYLKRNVLQLEYARTSAIIVSIIVLVIFSEALSAYMRDKIYKET